MDFTPHSRLKSCADQLTENFDDKDSNETSEVETHRPFSILLMPRSLLIFKDEAYSGTSSSWSCINLLNLVKFVSYFFVSLICLSDYLHGINDNSLQCYDEVRNWFLIFISAWQFVSHFFALSGCEQSWSSKLSIRIRKCDHWSESRSSFFREDS